MTKINELQAKERLELNLLVKSVSRGVTNKGAAYLNLSLQDSSGNIEGKFWDVKPEDEKKIKSGLVYCFHFEVLDYNHALQLRIHQADELDQSTLDFSEYVIASKLSKSFTKQRVAEILSDYQNDHYRKLVQGMLDRVGERFYEYPAASKIHHGYMGGLVEHTLGMIEVAYQISKLYPQINRDLLVSGIFVHDLGKTVELGGIISSEYSNEGKLIGHISIGHGWLMSIAKDLGLEDTEESMLLRHMLLSHHGKLEFGSPVLPEIIEAEVLCLIDNLDARLNTLSGVLAGVKPGEWSQRIFALENRQFYKPKN